LSSTWATRKWKDYRKSQHLATSALSHIHPQLVEQCISNLSAKPHIIRLSGWTQTSDRLAMREIAYQLGQQTGNFFLSQKDDVPLDDDDEHNPFLEASPRSTSELPTVSLPPSSQLPGLISLLPTLSQSTLVILDGFDLFALHPRQSLLYCLLDTVQSCRAGMQGKGLAVIGITSRMDTINILEKRVKSRFSGRMIRIAPPKRPRDWVKFVKAVLLADIECVVKGSTDKAVIEEWRSSWETAVQNFLTNKATLDILDETFSITRDIRMLSRLLV
jgi:origin recognition complex subunit 4